MTTIAAAMTDQTTLTAPTLAEALARLSRRLDAAGVEGPMRDARLLAAHALDVDRIALHVDRDRRLSTCEQEALHRLGRRRAAGEPVSRIVGRREFWSLTFELSPATLDPRPDSETIVQAALDRLPDRDRPLSILDLGTGSGCLLIALLSERPRAWGVGVDVSRDAAATARRNAIRLGVADRAAFLVGDWGQALVGGFDLVVANPPYIAVPEFGALAPEVARFDPRRALVAGADGLDAYRALAPFLAGLLTAGGLAVLEVGAGQAPAVASILTHAGLAGLESIDDLAGVQRCVCGRK